MRASPTFLLFKILRRALHLFSRFLEFLFLSAMMHRHTFSATHQNGQWAGSLSLVVEVFSLAAAFLGISLLCCSSSFVCFCVCCVVKIFLNSQHHPRVNAPLRLPINRPTSRPINQLELELTPYGNYFRSQKRNSRGIKRHRRSRRRRHYFHGGWGVWGKIHPRPKTRPHLVTFG